MAIAPWSVLAGGKLRSDAEEERRRQTGERGRTTMGIAWERNEDERKVSHALEKVAAEVGAQSLTSGEILRDSLLHILVTVLMGSVAVAIAYLMQKVPYVFPILGGRKVEHLHSNLEALEIALSQEQIEYLESIVPFKKGFPYDFFVSILHLKTDGD